MTSEKAQVAKDKGNAAFKSGDYPTAIGHYTSAMMADRNDPTYPLNRAAAYLKLGKNEDAERDCNTVLSLSKRNVKALFRRGQARMGMSNLLEAQKDFSDILLAEPSNHAAQEEMKKLTGLIQQEKAKKSKVPVTLAPNASHPDPDPGPLTKTRRVPIRIVNPSAPSQSAPSVPAVEATNPGDPPSPSAPKASGPKSDTLEAISSRSLNTSVPPPSSTSETTPAPSRSAMSVPSTSPLSSSTPKLTSFKDAKQARENAKPSRVGGGIFRASGESTIFPTREANPMAKPSTMSSPPPSQRSQTNVTSHKPPSSLFDLTKTWASLPSPEERWEYFNTIAPSALPALCNTSLEPTFLVSILQTFLATLTASRNDNGTKERVAAYMNNFAKVPRFGTLLLFLSKSEKTVAKEIWMELGVDKTTGVWAPVA